MTAIRIPRQVYINVKDKGAAGDGTIDDSAAIAAAYADAASGGVVYFPAGTYRVTVPLVPKTGTKTLGSGQTATTISAGGTANMFAPTPGTNKLVFENITLSTTATGGHIFAPAGSLNTSLWFNVAAVQNNPAKSILKLTDAGYIDNMWLDCVLTHNGATSAPAFDFTASTTSRYNSNTWQRCQVNNTSAAATWFFDFMTTGSTDYVYDNCIRDVTAEITNGGFARIRGCNGFIFENINFYDQTTTTNHLFYVGSGTGGIVCRGTTFNRVGRRGGTLGANLADIYLEANHATRTYITNCNTGTQAGYVIATNGNSVVSEQLGTFLNVKDPVYNARGNGATDDSAAILSALTAANAGDTIYFPPGTYVVTGGPFAIPTGVRIMGAGQSATTIQNSGSGSDLFAPPTGANKITLQSLTVTSDGTAGHIFAPQGSLSTSLFFNCQFIQTNPAKSIFTTTGGLTDNEFLNCVLTHNGSASVPAINIVSGSTPANGNRWSRIQCNHTSSATASFFTLDNSAASTYNHNNAFRDITFQVCNSGCITLLGSNGAIIDNCNTDGLTTTTGHQIVIGGSTGGQASRGNMIRGYHRRAGSLGSGLVDISLGSSGNAISTSVQGCNVASGLGISIDLGSNQRGLLIDCENATITNQHQSQIIIDRGRFVGELVQIKTKAGVPIDGDYNITPSDGSIVGVDTTNNRLYVKYGGSYHYATLT